MAKIDSEEINLLDILANLYATVKRNLLLATLLPLAGAIIAIGLVYNSKDRFESSLLVETTLLSENECKFLFKQLDKVGLIPGLTPDEDRQVAGFKFEVVKSDASSYNMGASNNANDKSVYLEVTATVYNQKVFPSLQRAILNFINQSPPVVRHRAERERFYSDMIGRIEQEIKAMEEVKNQINSKVQATYLNPSELYSKSVELYKEKIQYEITLEDIKVVHLIKPFDSLTVDARPSKWKAGLIGFVIGFIIFWFVVFVKFFGSYYKKYQLTH